MGLFNWFQKKPLPVSLPQLCYDVAYFILPHYAFGDLAKVTDLCLNTPSAAGPFFYLMATSARKIEPVMDDAKRFRWHHGQLSEGSEYFVLEYPSSPPVDMSNMSIEQVMNSEQKLVLAPHFSAIVRRPNGVQYFVLGQSPMGGGTTLRCILPEGMNCNLGPGPKPELLLFLDVIRTCETR